MKYRILWLGIIALLVVPARAALLRVRGESASAKESITKVAMQPDYEQAWQLLSTLCSDLRKTEDAVRNQR